MSARQNINPFGGDRSGQIVQPPSRGESVLDRCFRGLALVATGSIILVMTAIILEIGGNALPAMQDLGWSFLIGTDWDVGGGDFGILPMIWGTLYSSLLALMLAGIFGISIAVLLTQSFLPPSLDLVLRNIVELLAAIPSVIYGLWGIYVVIPMLRPLAGALHANFDWVPLFSTSLSGPGMLPAALVLAIMILPTVAAISQDSLRAVPHKVIEAVYGMGATRWEAILRVILPTAGKGIFGALVLGLGRALGETMALAMLIGNSNQLSISLFSPANTLAALLALNFPEAGTVEVSALMYAAVVLLLITLLVNLAGAAIIGRASQQAAGD